MQSRTDDRSLGELFGELARQTSNLLHKEMDLTRVEMTRNVSRLGGHVASIAVGGAIAYAGLLALLAAAIAGLATVLAWWLAALIVGLVVVVVGYFLIQRALGALRRESLAPRQTLRTLREDAEWAKEQVGGGQASVPLTLAPTRSGRGCARWSRSSPRATTGTSRSIGSRSSRPATT